MSVPLQQVFSADSMELRFTSYYDQKAFMHDVSRLRALAGMRDHGQKVPYTEDRKDFSLPPSKSTLNEAELAEVVEIRKRIRRLDADTAMLLVIENRLRGGYNFI